MHNIAASLQSVRAEISGAAEAAGRSAKIELIAVSKGQGADAVRAALQAGQTVFGENRVQEAASKFPALRAEFPQLRLHLIGPLQSNKTRKALELFDVLHSVDRMELVQELARHRDLWTGKKFLLQVNTGLEPQKSGLSPHQADHFIAACKKDYQLPISGLMAIPPLGHDPAPHFQMLADIAKRHNLPELSMGMSADFAEAIAYGATMVRIGTAIFGAR